MFSEIGNEKKEKRLLQKELEALARKKILMLVLAGCLLFCIPVFGLQFLSLRVSGQKHLDFLQETFETEYSHAVDFLTSDAANTAFSAVLHNRLYQKEVQYTLSRYNATAGIPMDLLLLDADRNFVYSNLNEEDITLHRLAFSRAAANNAAGNALYNTVYYLNPDDSEYVFCLPLDKDGACFGYVLAFLDGNGWSHILSAYQYDSVLTNRRGDVIYCSKSAFLTESAPSRFAAADGSLFLRVNGVRYSVMNRTLADKGVELHSVIYSPKNTISLVIGVLALAALGLISYMVFRRAAQVMADKNAHSVEQLVDEIKIIRNGDGQHIISIQTGDEYEMIAEQINKMVNSINSLNARNTELSYLNSAIELRNLQAQMNPHFIYNTLDNIKYLIPDDPGTAVRLIEKFAEILRYSINNTRALVPLEEDERYIRDYLFIQQTRFGERFAWTMEIEPGCERCTIPKLLAQPLLENSIKYGFRRKMELRVALNVRREGEYLAISVHDDGPGVSAEELETLRRMVADPTAESEHHGLRNLARRLRLQYGTGSGLILSGSEGEGFTVTAKLWNGGK